MAVVKDKIIFCSTKLQDFSSEPIGSENFYSRYDEFIRLFARIIPSINFEEYFAEPYFNKDTKNLDWYVPDEGGDLLRVTDLEQLDSTAFHEALRMHQALIEAVKRARESHAANLGPFFNAVLLGLEGDNYRYWRDNHLVYVVWGVKAKPGRKIEMKFSDDIINRRAYKIKYLIEGQGSLTINEIARIHNHILQGEQDIPNVIAAERYEFKTWLPFPPQGVKVVSDMTFTAVFELDNKTQVKFKASKGGCLQGETTLYFEKGYPLNLDDFPQTRADNGYRFENWAPTCNFPITLNDDMKFTAIFSAIDNSGNNHGESSFGNQDGEGHSESGAHDLDDISYDVFFLPGEHGYLQGQTQYKKRNGEVVHTEEIPYVIAEDGYEFIGWDKNPENHVVHEDVSFIAQYRQSDSVVTERDNDRTVFWNHAGDVLSGIMKTLLSLLLLFLICPLLWFLFGNHDLNFCGCDCNEQIVIDSIHPPIPPTPTPKPNPEPPQPKPCDEIQREGSNHPESLLFDLGQEGGSFVFEYATGGVYADEIVIYDGETKNNNIIFQTHDVTGGGGWDDRRTAIVSFSGSAVLVDVIPDPSPNTYWEIKVHCP